MKNSPHEETIDRLEQEQMSRFAKDMLSGPLKSEVLLESSQLSNLSKDEKAKAQLLKEARDAGFVLRSRPVDLYPLRREVTLSVIPEPSRTAAKKLMEMERVHEANKIAEAAAAAKEADKTDLKNHLKKISLTSQDGRANFRRVLKSRSFGVWKFLEC